MEPTATRINSRAIRSCELRIVGQHLDLVDARLLGLAYATWMRARSLRRIARQGRWLLRACGTEPKLTIRCEAADESGLERLRKAVGGHLNACGIKAS